MRKEGRKQLEEEQERVRLLLAKENAEIEIGGNNQTLERTEGPTKLKIRWRARSSENSYTAENLKTIFSKYGDVNVVVVSASSSAIKGSALIEMADQLSAEMAAKIEQGFAGNPLTIKLLQDVDHKTPAEGDSKEKNKVTNHQTNAVHNNSAVNFQDYENLVLRKMRQAEERKRLEQEILEQDKIEESLERPKI